MRLNQIYITDIDNLHISIVASILGVSEEEALKLYSEFIEEEDDG